MYVDGVNDVDRDRDPDDGLEVNATTFCSILLTLRGL
jgi:hypothetical protein